jgi:hypothetical protein
LRYVEGWAPVGHSDGPVYGPWRLQMMAYFDDVPPDSGAFTVWVLHATPSLASPYPCATSPRV